MEEISMPNLLILAGSGRNSGKTTFACSLINKFSYLYPVVAVKISPHFHSLGKNLVSLIDNQNFFVEEESNRVNSKDSSRMLAAGAEKSFFVMTSDDHLKEAWKQVIPLIGTNKLIVCESGGLRNFIKPGLFLMIDRFGKSEKEKDTTDFKMKCDRWVTFDGVSFDISLDLIQVINYQWKIA